MLSLLQSCSRSLQWHEETPQGEYFQGLIPGREESHVIIKQLSWLSSQVTLNARTFEIS